MTLAGYRLAWLQKAARTGAIRTDHFGSCTAAWRAATELMDARLLTMDLVDSYRITAAGREALQAQLVKSA